MFNVEQILVIYAVEVKEMFSWLGTRLAPKTLLENEKMENEEMMVYSIFFFSLKVF